MYFEIDFNSHSSEISINNLVLQMREVKALAQDTGSSKGSSCERIQDYLTPGIMFFPLACCLAST